MRVCFDCGYRGPERACPHDGLPTFDEGGRNTLAEQPDLIGRVFADRYEVVDVIGGGGMGAVFLARHRAMQQDVALKVLKKDIANHPGAIKRFFREARLSAQLSHPNTIRVYDFGASDDGQLYLAMEYLQGRTLGAILREDGRLPPERAINVARQICAALDAAHGAEMVHRDLKPDNIFLTSLRNAPDFVKVLDFGIAKPVGDDDPERSGLTHTGLMVGTPRYMSPEQAQGLPIDARSDLYALGVLLYEMLTGVVPFDAPTPVALLVRHCNEAPPPLPERIGGTVVPMSMRQLVAWLLEKSPANRPQSAAEVEDALVRIAAGGHLLTDDDHTLSVPVVGPALFSAESDSGAQSRTTATDLHGKRRRMWLLGIAAAVIVGAGVFVFATADGGDVEAPKRLVVGSGQAEAGQDARSGVDAGVTATGADQERGGEGLAATTSDVAMVEAALKDTGHADEPGAVAAKEDDVSTMDASQATVPLDPPPPSQPTVSKPEPKTVGRSNPATRKPPVTRPAAKAKPVEKPAAPLDVPYDL